MRVYIVERLPDGPSERADEVARAHYPGAEIIHGTRAIGLGRWGSAADWKRAWPDFLATLDVTITARRTLALGGTIEVEDSMAAGLPVFTVHGRKLTPIGALWYAELDCLSSGCLQRRHRSRMHADPQRVAETRTSTEAERPEQIGSTRSIGAWGNP